MLSYSHICLSCNDTIRIITQSYSIYITYLQCAHETPDSVGSLNARSSRLCCLLCTYLFYRVRIDKIMKSLLKSGLQTGEQWHRAISRCCGFKRCKLRIKNRNCTSITYASIFRGSTVGMK